MREMTEGHQSTVYLGHSGDRLVVIKLIDAAYLDKGLLQARLSMLSQLSSVTTAACAPIPLQERLIHDVQLAGSQHFYAVCYEHAEGDAPDVAEPTDASAMGTLLAELHEQLAELPSFALPPITNFQDRAGMRAAASELGIPPARLSDISPANGFGEVQLLHGDFSSANIRTSSGQSRIFDFDDSGYGPIEFDLAEALYAVLFDAHIAQAFTRYKTFRSNFLAGYAASSGSDISELSLDNLISQRVLTLASWIMNLSSAPPAIRSSSSSWIDTLRGFVISFFGTDWTQDRHLPEPDSTCSSRRRT